MDQSNEKNKSWNKIREKVHQKRLNSSCKIIYPNNSKDLEATRKEDKHLPVYKYLS
jgi:hypothetical protein